MKIDNLEVGQLVSNGEYIAVIKFDETYGDKYYCYVRDEKPVDVDDADIMFVVDMDDKIFL